MKRSILLSLMVIGAASALLIGAGTFAPFTDTDTEEGDVTAGTVAIDVYGSTPLDFELVSTVTDCDNIAPGDVCDATATVENIGSLAVDLDDPVNSDIIVVDVGDDCEDDDWLVTFDLTGYDDTLDPTDTTTFVVKVELEDDGDVNDCQGATATIEVSVTAANQ